MPRVQSRGQQIEEERTEQKLKIKPMSFLASSEIFVLVCLLNSFLLKVTFHLSTLNLHRN